MLVSPVLQSSRDDDAAVTADKCEVARAQRARWARTLRDRLGGPYLATSGSLGDSRQFCMLVEDDSETEEFAGGSSIARNKIWVKIAQKYILRMRAICYDVQFETNTAHR